MPFVNVYPTKLVRGLRKPINGVKKNINLSEEEIKICKIYGAEVEYVGGKPKKNVAPKVEVVEEKVPEQKTEEVKPVEETKEEATEAVVEETADAVVETKEETVEAAAEEKTEEVEANEVADEQKKTSQNKNSGKKKNN